MRAWLILVTILGSCSEQDVDKAVAERQVVAPPPAAPTPPASATVGGDGSTIVLNPLSAAEIDAAALGGELACSFAVGDTTLLLGKGDVATTEPSFAIVKIGDDVERLAAPGGFDAMLGGATFSGRGTSATIALTGPPIGGGESPPRPATLSFDRMDGARRSFAGRWSCGP